MEMDTLLYGLPDDVKENIGECNYEKGIWYKIKYLYLDKAYQLELSLVYNKSIDEEFSMLKLSLSVLCMNWENINKGVNN